jgi:hypothetical protein
MQQIRYLADQWNFAAEQRILARYQSNISRISTEIRARRERAK